MRSNLLKVLIIYPKFYVYGGGEKLVVRLCNYLTAQGVRNDILTTQMIPEVQADLKNTGVIIAENRRGGAIGELTALCAGVRRHAAFYDVINPHNYPAEVAAFFSSRPSVWMCNEPELLLSLEHGSFNWKYRWFLRALAPFERHVVRRRIDRWVVADRFNADRFRGIYGREPSVIPYGIDSDFFSAGDSEHARRKLGIGDEFVVLHVGMMTPLKNQMASLSAIDELKEAVPNLKLVLAGSWEEGYKGELDAFTGSRGLGGRVLSTGHIDSDELREWYRASDVLLHPIKSQGGWLSPFEALCAETPIVVSREMTASYLIGSHDLGTVTDDYAKALLDVYRDRERHVQTAKRGAEWVRSNLSWDAFGEGMLNVFREAMEAAA